MVPTTNASTTSGGAPRIPEVLRGDGPRDDRPSRGRVFLAGLGVALSVLYLLNIPFGIIEALPDNIPILGNVDEAGMTLLLIKCLGVLRRR